MPRPKLLRAIPLFVLLGALIPAAAAVASTAPGASGAGAGAGAGIVTVAANACAAALRDYPLGDAAQSELELRRQAWIESAGSEMSGVSGEAAWQASVTQILALETAVAWGRRSLRAQIAGLDAAQLPQAEGDLVWVVEHEQGHDDQIASLLALSVQDRAAAVAASGGTGDAALPEVSIDEIQQFAAEMRVARHTIPSDALAAYRQLRADGSVEALGEEAALLAWTQQQGERGAELLAAWNPATAASAAALRSVLAGAADGSVDGVQDACVRAVSRLDGDAVSSAATVARRSIALQLTASGRVRG